MSKKGLKNFTGEFLFKKANKTYEKKKAQIFSIINDICWYKPNAPPNLSCRYFTHSHESIIWARKNGKHTFDYEYTKYGYFPERGPAENIDHYHQRLFITPIQHPKYQPPTHPPNHYQTRWISPILLRTSVGGSCTIFGGYQPSIII